MVRADEFVLEVRDSAFVRQGQIDLGLVTGGKFVKRLNAVGAWQFTVANEHPLCPLLKTPNSGILLWLGDRPYLSGPMVTWTETRSLDDPDGVTTFTGADDMVALADKGAWPTPTSADITNGQTDAYDVRTGPLETVLKNYVRANVGNAAPAARHDRLSDALVIEPDEGRGPTVTGSARFDQVGALLAELAAVDGSYGFDVVQDPVTLRTVFSIYRIEDRSDVVRMDVANGLLESTKSGIAAPDLTRALVAGQGQGADRQFFEITDDEAVAAETLWGRRIEQFIDQRQTDDVDQLTQAGVKAIADGGHTIVSMKVVPADDTTMRYGFDWRTGTRVGVVVNEQVLVDVATEAIIVVDSGDVAVGATIGDPVGYDWEAAVQKAVRDHGSRLSRLERGS